MSGQNKPERIFSQSEAAQILGVSESYMKRLDSDWGENLLVRMRRNSRGQPIYSATEIMVMKEMGIGRCRGTLRPLSEVMQEMNVPRFGADYVVDTREQRVAKQAAIQQLWQRIREQEQREETRRQKAEQREEARRQRVERRRLGERLEERVQPWWRRILGI